MFLKQRENVLNEIKALEKALAMIEYKCWYYDEAEKDGNEQRVKDITLGRMPARIRELYQKAVS